MVTFTCDRSKGLTYYAVDHEYTSQVQVRFKLSRVSYHSVGFPVLSTGNNSDLSPDCLNFEKDTPPEQYGTSDVETACICNHASNKR